MRAVVSVLMGIVLVALLNFQNTEAKMNIEQARKAVAGVRKGCIKKSGVSEEILNNASKGQFVADPALQCYEKCLLDKSKAMKDGKVDVPSMLQQADIMLNSNIVGRFKEVITLCSEAITSTEPCEAAWQFAKCFYETDSSTNLKRKRRSRFRRAVCRNSRTQRNCRRV